MVFMAKFRAGVVALLILQCLSVFLLIRTGPNSSKEDFLRDTSMRQFVDVYSHSGGQHQDEDENAKNSPVDDVDYDVPLAEIYHPSIRGFYEGEVLSYQLLTIENNPLRALKMNSVVLFQETLNKRARLLRGSELFKILKPLSQDIYNYIPYESPEDRKIAEYTRGIENETSANASVSQGSKLPSSHKELAQKLLLKMTTPGKHCKKTVKIGGRSMNKMPDGEKYMCMDPDTKLDAKSCLVYSFGIGYDFSFERMMGIFGCRVMAFDDDEAHSKFSRTPYNRVNFIGVRLSPSDKIEAKTVTEIKKDGQRSTYSYLYRPLDNILWIAGHEDAVLDYLKMDIEGSEWSAFETSIFKSEVLSRTRYLAVEIHMQELIDPQLKNSSHIYTQLRKYLRFFDEIENRGFQLMHYEPNFIKPKFQNIFGSLIPAFAELVWWNPDTSLSARAVRSSTRDMESIVAELED